jgi:hypothetical protein
MQAPIDEWQLEETPAPSHASSGGRSFFLTIALLGMAGFLAAALVMLGFWFVVTPAQVQISHGEGHPPHFQIQTGGMGPSVVIWGDAGDRDTDGHERAAHESESQGQGGNPPAASDPPATPPIPVEAEAPLASTSAEQPPVSPVAPAPEVITLPPGASASGAGRDLVIWPGQLQLVNDAPAWSPAQPGATEGEGLVVIRSHRFTTPEEAWRDLYALAAEWLNRRFQPETGTTILFPEEVLRMAPPGELALQQYDQTIELSDQKTLQTKMYIAHLKLPLSPRLRELVYADWRSQTVYLRIWTFVGCAVMATLAFALLGLWLRTPPRGGAHNVAPTA